MPAPSSGILLREGRRYLVLPHVLIRISPVRFQITSLIGQGLICQSDIFLDNNFQSEGNVDFNSSQIDNDFKCTNGKFYNENGCALNCENISIKRNLLFKN